MNLQNSGKPCNSGRIASDQTFRYCGVLLYFGFIILARSVCLQAGLIVASNTSKPVTADMSLTTAMTTQESAFLHRNGQVLDHRTHQAKDVSRTTSNRQARALNQYKRFRFFWHLRSKNWSIIQFTISLQSLFWNRFLSHLALKFITEVHNIKHLPHFITMR